MRSMHRIESGITPGASDVEYAAHVFHGWIELKTAAQPRKGKPYALHCAFTTTQSEWLLQHNDTKQYLRSWLLLGIIGPRTWREFILIDPNNAIALLQGRTGIAHEELLVRAGVHQYASMRGLIKSLDW